MSRAEHGAEVPPHGPDSDRGKVVARQHEPLDFEAAADASTTSWERADPKAALIERWGRYGYLVTLPDGDAHFCALGRDDDALIGFCKCKGFRHHSGPCAHLCTVRKAAFVGLEAVNGDPVEIAPMAETDLVDEEHTAAQVAGEVFEEEHSRLDGPTFDDLTDAERAAYKAVHADGQQPAEFARQTGRSPSTARTLLQRARDKVGREVEG